VPMWPAGVPESGSFKANHFFFFFFEGENSRGKPLLWYKYIY